MKLNTLFSIAAVYMGVVGLGFLLAPEAISLGIVSAGASAALLGYLRIPTGAFLGIAVLNWMARNAEASTARNAILFANTVGFALAGVLGVLSVLSGAPVTALVFAAINLVFAIAFFWTGKGNMAAAAK